VSKRKPKRAGRASRSTLIEERDRLRASVREFVESHVRMRDSNARLIAAVREARTAAGNHTGSMAKPTGCAPCQMVNILTKALHDAGVEP